MSIVDRVEEIRAHEHQRLRIALQTAGAALEEAQLAEAQRLAEAAALVPKVDLFGDPLPASRAEVAYAGRTPAPQERRVDYAAIVRRWQPVEDAVLARLDAWEEELLPLLRRWLAGEGVDAEVQAAAEGLAQSRDRLQALLGELRGDVWFVPTVSDPMRALFAAIERCDRAEVEEILPALRSGDRDAADQVARSQTPEAVSRNLREALKKTPEPKPVVAKDPLMELLGWFGLTRKGDQKS